MDLRERHFLIGDVEPQICGNKLPSTEQVLKVLLYNMKHVNNKKPVRDSARLVLDELKIFWEKARLPIRHESRCLDIIVALHKEYMNLKKNKGQLFNIAKEEQFISRIKCLFDISHGNILNDLDDNDPRKIFFLNQRKDGRLGYINDVASYYDILEENEKRRQEILTARLERHEIENNKLNDVVELASSSEGTSQGLSQKSVGYQSTVSFESEREAGPSAAKRLRGTINIFNDKVVAALDKSKVSNRDAVHLVSAIAESLEIDTATLTLNTSSIRAIRQKIRQARAEKVKSYFKTLDLKCLIVHYDGKLIQDLNKKEKVERLPIVVSNGKIEKILHVPALNDSKGITQANAVYDVLKDWGLLESVKGICCDTTASNLGSKNGSAVLLQSLLMREILFLPCRHHIFELVLRCVFEKYQPYTTGPNIPLFKNFKLHWKHINQKNYKTGIEDNEVKKLINLNDIHRISTFVKQVLETRQPRDDYKELLELTLIYLGCLKPDTVSFYLPGAYHHARFMAKAIYSLKIFIFRDQYEVSSEEKSAVRQTTIFIVLHYIEAWFTCSEAAKAPNHDLQFLKKLHNYKLKDEKLSQLTVQKFRNHLWYLTPESAGLAFFDESLSADIKRKMVLKLNGYDNIDIAGPKKIRLDVEDVDIFVEKQIDAFVTPQTKNIFERFDINSSFLKIDPNLWAQNEDYQNGFKIVTELRVVNDAAERAVHLFDEYNPIITKNEEQNQYVVQIVSEFRKAFPDAKKQTVTKQF